MLRVHAEGGVERETIEMLFQVLSPECRDEMDAALVHSDADMSDGCKKEIETNLEKLQYSKSTGEETHDHGGDPGTSSGADNRNQAGSKSKTSSSTTKEDDAATTVMMYVTGFITFIFASAGVYIYFVNASKPKDAYRPQKKLSKQKQEKQRQKGMR